MFNGQLLLNYFMKTCIIGNCFSSANKNNVNVFNHVLKTVILTVYKSAYA